MKESRKEFIKKAHSSACSEWKTNIEKEFPKLFKKDALVVGKWYEYPDFENWKLLITDNTKGKEKGVGFNCSGIWMKDWSTTGSDELNRLIPCLDNEVKQALIKEAKKRGFNLDVNFEFVKGGVNYSHIRTVAKVGSNFKYEDGRLQSLGYGDWTIFNNGVWATIIHTITKEEAKIITNKIEVLKNELLNKTIVD